SPGATASSLVGSERAPWVSVPGCRARLKSRTARNAEGRIAWKGRRCQKGSSSPGEEGPKRRRSGRAPLGAPASRRPLTRFFLLLSLAGSGLPRNCLRPWFTTPRPSRPTGREIPAQGRGRRPTPWEKEHLHPCGLKGRENLHAGAERCHRPPQKEFE